MDDFPQVNAAYGAFFTEPYPARSTIEAARLPRDARIGIDAVAAYAG
jgi:2-iminobutanoate/2-iminopropanoate deaminase